MSSLRSDFGELSRAELRVEDRRIGVERAGRVKPGNVRDRSAIRMSFEDGAPEMHRADALRTDGMSGDAWIGELPTEKL